MNITRSYSLKAPANTHRKSVNCQEANCQNYQNGWRIRVEGLDLEMLQAARNSGRKFTELQVAENETYLVFEAGQPCFKAGWHSVPLEREPFYLVREGQSRPKLHARGEDWVEDFSDHLDKFEK
jgi:hypothetical protein